MCVCMYVCVFVGRCEGGNTIIIYWMKIEYLMRPNYSGGDVSFTYQAEDRAKFPNLRKFGSILCLICV